MSKTTIRRWSTGRWMLTYIALIAPAYAIEKLWLKLGDGWPAWGYSVTVVVAAIITLHRLEMIDLMRQVDARVEELKRARQDK